MFELLRRFVQEGLIERKADVAAKYQMLRFADFWYHLGWILYYEQAFVDLRRKWERQAYDPENIYRLVKKHILRK